MTPRWASIGAVSVLGALALACGAPPPTGAGSPGQPNYVAMGDSAAAEPGVPDPAPPPGCQKSTHNYPSVLARRIGATSFTDVTCSGATTDDITSRAQPTSSGPVPPQIDAVGADTTLITITIGGNDVALAGDAAQCRAASLDSPPCAQRFVTNGVDSISAAINAQVPVWGTMIDDVRAKAPAARIVLVGYLTYIRPGGCFPDQPVLPTDADYFESKVNELDDRQMQLAAAKGIDFFDTRQLSVGHDMCAPPDQRYVEGFVAANPAAPLHPNAMGAAAVGNALADWLARR
ncbi:SGNH/GDSL hydrolase family protein [Mycobacterium kyorinense]|uniref:SGNH/GDSL hydrolase family protein n=1 Tax=Mycobacterium kyorinense TaxID=487514 RepID=UPI0005F09A49|nr:SGNH/GDSL hydrolase family protein [Mycobacterium kyorinense]